MDLARVGQSNWSSNLMVFPLNVQSTNWISNHSWAYLASINKTSLLTTVFNESFQEGLTVYPVWRLNVLRNWFLSLQQISISLLLYSYQMIHTQSAFRWCNIFGNSLPQIASNGSELELTKSRPKFLQWFLFSWCWSLPNGKIRR